MGLSAGANPASEVRGVISVIFDHNGFAATRGMKHTYNTAAAKWWTAK